MVVFIARPGLIPDRDRNPLHSLERQWRYFVNYLFFLWVQVRRKLLVITGLQAPTQGGSWGVWPGGGSRPTPGEGVSPGPHPGGPPSPCRGVLQAHTRGGVSRPTPRGGVPQHALRQTPLPPMATAAGGTHPCWNAFLYLNSRVVNDYVYTFLSRTSCDLFF